ncbi:hypothetical protein FLAG1_07872 [Fusarium langsethiae]|uniref:Uncharacterized protein n=1 Tax=Fusarium langsethiae TaxID=179993 RepID=A0A0N0V635_FUSLA|nr:hypothetical protein FLAG1_07872 [Fusarium langsethiae]GKU08053.1 unnamed protein product [Fusarium langsethiae]
MAEIVQDAPQDAQVGWLELKSDKGQDYRVKASDYDISEGSSGGDAPSASGPPFNVPVNWHVGDEGAPSQEIQDKTAITWYKFEKAPWYSPYQYKLTINTRDTYNYTFFDSEPDYYGLNVFDSSGSHSVEFRSDNPTNTSITGT